MATVGKKSRRGGSKPGERRGGRSKGTPNKTTAAIKDAILSVYADLQAESGEEHGHFLAWAKESPTDFYKLAAKLLPLQVTGEGGQPLQVVMQSHDDRL
jgi:hypothetical protein